MDLDDFMTFEVGPDRRHATIMGDGARYEGSRARVLCRLATKQYGNPFGLDVGIGDPMVHEPDEIVAEDPVPAGESVDTWNPASWTWAMLSP